jgi:hypothetical protein
MKSKLVFGVLLVFSLVFVACDMVNNNGDNGDGLVKTTVRIVPANSITRSVARSVGDSDSLELNIQWFSIHRNEVFGRGLHLIGFNIHGGPGGSVIDNSGWYDVTSARSFPIQNLDGGGKYTGMGLQIIGVKGVIAGTSINKTFDGPQIIIWSDGPYSQVNGAPSPVKTYGWNAMNIDSSDELEVIFTMDIEDILTGDNLITDWPDRITITVRKVG